MSKGIKFHPLNEHQEQALDAIDKNDITFLIGPAGSAKSHLSVAYAVNALLENKYSKMYIARPVIETAGESLGFLPGTFEQKLDPYLTPIYDILDQLFDESQIEIKKSIMERVKIAPIAFVRGRTFSKAICILDEAQNATLPQLKAWMTRLGMGSKMIINGDPTQSDLPKGASRISEITHAMDGKDGIAVVRLPKSAIVRHPVVETVINVFEEMGI